MDASRETSDSRIDWVQVFFSASGRSGRLEFAGSAGLVLALFAAFDQGVHGAVRWLTGWAALPLLFVSAACILSKRLHDRGRAGWWAALVLWAFAVVWPRPHGVIDGLFLAMLACAFVELALRPGQAGFNRFGPPPR